MCRRRMYACVHNTQRVPSLRRIDVWRLCCSPLDHTCAYVKRVRAQRAGLGCIHAFVANTARRTEKGAGVLLTMSLVPGHPRICNSSHISVLAISMLALSTWKAILLCRLLPLNVVMHSTGTRMLLSLSVSAAHSPQVTYNQGKPAAQITGLALWPALLPKSLHTRLQTRFIRRPT